MKTFAVFLFALILTPGLSHSLREPDHAELAEAELVDTEMEFGDLMEEGLMEHEDRRLGGCKYVYKWTYNIRRPRFQFNNGVQYRRVKATCKEGYNKVEEYEVDWKGDCKYDKENCEIKSGHTVECRLGVSRQRKGCKVKYVDALLKVKCCK